MGKDLAHRATDRMLNLTSVKVAVILVRPPTNQTKSLKSRRRPSRRSANDGSQSSNTDGVRLESVD